MQDGGTKSMGGCYHPDGSPCKCSCAASSKSLRTEVDADGQVERQDIVKVRETEFPQFFPKFLIPQAPNLFLFAYQFSKQEKNFYSLQCTHIFKGRKGEGISGGGGA